MRGGGEFRLERAALVLRRDRGFDVSRHAGGRKVMRDAPLDAGAAAARGGACTAPLVLGCPTGTFTVVVVTDASHAL